ncbi:hypothetical protein [Acinetobacter sp. MD2(2019)]|uniref:hypothetical protein n=1 Tax=Acinetobacter sp. MD2(2019) TaxID=2605273 RepID=UPI002D1F4010|nr:hypothetical protein [Acinetobacter sp. MD2(2019)]MEB3753279.1 hypothetical protein [Acinetobacter sp. MD2(2019)]
MHNLLRRCTPLFLLTASLSLASFAETTTTPTNTLPDNPSLGRMLLYKTGQTITRVGDATQRGADRASQKIATTWDNSKTVGAQTGQAIENKTEQVKEATAQKWQQTKEVVTSSRPSGTNIPIEQVSLSQ